MSEDICYGFCSLLTSISKILQYNLRSFIYTQGGVSMKRTVLLVFLSTLFLFTAVFSASAASGGEVAVSWVDSNWAIEGGLYLTDKVSAWGSYWPFGGGESQFKASVGYDISKTDQGTLRASAGVLAVTSSGSTDYAPTIGLSGKATLSDQLFVSGSFDYAFQTGNLSARSVYDIGVGYVFTEGFYVGAKAAGNLSDSGGMKFGISVGLTF